VGIVIGIVFAALSYWMSQGRRDFRSVSQTMATKYELLAEHKVAGQARELIGTMPGARAAQFNPVPPPTPQPQGYGSPQPPLGYPQGGYSYPPAAYPAAPGYPPAGQPYPPAGQPYPPSGFANPGASEQPPATPDEPKQDGSAGA